MIQHRLPAALVLPIVACATTIVRAADYTPGVQHNYTHESGDVPEDTYQYSVWVPKSYKHDRTYPLVFFLHGGKGRVHPNQGKRNMVRARLGDNQNWTDGC